MREEEIQSANTQGQQDTPENKSIQSSKGRLTRAQRKLQRKQETQSQRKLRRARTAKRTLIALSIVLAVIVLLSGLVHIGNAVSVSRSLKYASSMPQTDYVSQLTPQKDSAGNYVFTTNNDFRIMQLTDIHIGGGWMSQDEDKKAISAVASMIIAEQPDLVVITGDISFPVPFISGSMDNIDCHTILATLLNKLGVYWTITLGNHDSEAYNYYDREDVAEFYEEVAAQEGSYCIFTRGDEDIDGEGNQLIKICNTEGQITQALFMFDSHSYTNGDILGLRWLYDNIKESQINWYVNTLAALKQENNNVMPKSLAFYHIPTEESQVAWDEYVANGRQNTANVRYVSGVGGEAKAGAEAGTKVSYGPVNENQLFETFIQQGSTQAIFNGHDHLNNFVIEYNGGSGDTFIKIVYGYSIDYLAYSSIDEYGAQRGCTMVTVHTDSDVTIKHENYYQDKYSLPDYKKETVTMEDYYK